MIDQARVAKAISEGKVADNVVVMGPKILSELYDLEIIDENLQDNKENFTSFLMVKRF